MSVQLCQCIPCFAKRDYEITDAEDRSSCGLLPLDTLELALTYLDKNSLLAASAVCVRWRFIAATIYSKYPDRMYSTPCFQPFYDDFYISRHIFLFDVSSSMNAARQQNAQVIYDKITQFIAPIIKNRGTYICKFAGGHELKYFHTSEKAKAYVAQKSTLNDGSNLSDAVVAVVDKIIERSENAPKNTHVHIISDMEVLFDQSILSREDLHRHPSKITFHYHDAAKQDDTDFVTRTKATFLKLKDTPIPEMPKQNKKLYSDSVEIKFYRSKKSRPDL